MPLFEIVGSNQPIVVNSVNILIYGEPGAGKTSLSNTASRPLTLDFDKGAHRSEFRKDVLIIENWEKINNNTAEFLKLFNNYDTIILDTVDTLLDYMGAWIVSVEPKLAKNKLQFYGKLKDEFSLFVGKIKTLGKDIIMIAHAKEKEEGEFRVKRPAITGGSYDKVLQTADFVGFVCIKDEKRFINFYPTDYTVGKNSAKIPPQSIPSFEKTPDYFAGLIKLMKDSMNQKSAAQAESVNKLLSIKDTIEAFKTAEELNNFFGKLSSMTLSTSEKTQVWNWLKAHGETLGCAYIKDDGAKTGKFYPPAEPEPKIEPTPEINKPAAPAQEPMPWE
jgi:phage nucleotide-binding protein